MHGVKKRCKSCVDKMMKACDNSLKILSDKEVENHLIKKLIVLFQITQPEGVHDSDVIIIDDDDNNEMVKENRN